MASRRPGHPSVPPVVSCGAFSARAVVGEHLPITATVFREGHDAVAADVVVTGPDGSRQPFDRVAAEADDDWRDRVAEAAAALRDTSRELPARVAPALAEALQRYLHDHPVRELVTPGPENEVWVDRPRALFGSWYEFFPRSTGPVVDGRATHGTFATSAARLPAIADMGFDVVYLPPIHPIGTVNRKGPNSTQFPGGNPHEIGPDDVGSPWAIGSAQGGHYAENPPKKYQDIYPINFDNDPEGIYAECLRVIRVWIEAGVKIFRVDNPHTKPLNFWHWLIWEVKKTDPDVLFLAEAFTRPAMMHQLAKLGFTQSYTYFTWRTERSELEEYGRELARNAHYMRPNFFVNTPDILHETLQFGGPPMFKIRAVLASMMSPTWGVYSGFELFEHVAVRPG